MSKINVSIIGASGYTGSELIRILVNHPSVNIVSAVSQSQKGKKVSELFPDLINETEIEFCEFSNKSADVVFLCLQHGTAQNYLKENPELLSKKIIDLSRDFRIEGRNSLNNTKFVYGLPELNKDSIKQANYIANPGCFATALQLGLLPLADKNLLNSTIVINAMTGSTGAGIKLSDTTHFSWRQNNASVYQAFNHPHNEEIIQSITNLQPTFNNSFVFIPQRGSFTRGILATIIVETIETLENINSIYNEYYKEDFFTNLIESEVSLKQVINTNKCLLNIQKKGNQLLIISVIDNLIKGAAGQAIQNMNLMFGLPEEIGLKLKNNSF